MEKPQAKIKFTALEVIEKSLLRRSEDVPLKINFNFDIKVDSKVNPLQKTILVFIEIDIRGLEKDPVLGRMAVVCGFEIENFDEVIIKQTDIQYNIPPDVDVLTKTVSLSTVRGVIYSEFRGTYLANAILPIIILNPISASENQQNMQTT